MKPSLPPNKPSSTTVVKRITKKNAPTTQPKRKTPIVRQPRPPRAGMREVSLVCGLTDPFCAHANGARYHDDNGARSLAYPQRRLFSITTDANGSASMLILPNYNNEWFHPSATLVGATANYESAFTPGTLLPYAPQYRIVSWGFRFHNITTPISASGMVFIRGLSSQLGSSYNNVVINTNNADVISNTPLQDCHDVAVIGKRANTTSRFYSGTGATMPVSGYPNTWNGNGWDGYNIGIIGATPTTTVAVVELIMNMEIVIDDSDATAQLMTPPPPSSTVLNQATAVVTSTAESVFVAGITAASTYIKRAAATALGSYFGGPAGAMVARMVD